MLSSRRIVGNSGRLRIARPKFRGVLVVAGLAQVAVLVLLAGRAVVLGARANFHYVYVRPANLPAVADPVHHP